MSEAHRLLRPTSVRPAGDFRYAIDLADDDGPTRTIHITLQWEDRLRRWVASGIEGYSMSEPARFDTRPMVGLAIAMHRAIHDQFPGGSAASGADSGADDAVWAAARIVVDLLARGAYNEVAALTRGVRLTADEMKRAIADYGRTPTPLPDEARAMLDVVQVQGASPPRFSVQVPMWTAEEGRSDLTLDLELTELAPFAFETALMDIHVL